MITNAPETVRASSLLTRFELCREATRDSQGTIHQHGPETFVSDELWDLMALGEVKVCIVQAAGYCNYTHYLEIYLDGQTLSYLASERN